MPHDLLSGRRRDLTGCSPLELAQHAIPESLLKQIGVAGSFASSSSPASPRPSKAHFVEQVCLSRSARDLGLILCGPRIREVLLNPFPLRRFSSAFSACLKFGVRTVSDSVCDRALQLIPDSLGELRPWALKSCRGLPHPPRLRPLPSRSWQPNSCRSDNGLALRTGRRVAHPLVLA